MTAVALDGVTYTYPGAAAPALRAVSLQIAPGELVLVAGGSGSGKSSLLRAISGLVPHFHGGTFAGRVTVAGIRAWMFRRERSTASFTRQDSRDPRRNSRALSHRH